MTETFEWTRSETLAMAVNSCSSCRGFGLVFGRKGASNPCHCVLRGIFRACFRHFQRCVTQPRHLSRVTLDRSDVPSSRFTYSRKDEEYIADFSLIVKRSLNAFDYRLFKLHYVLGGDWRICCSRLGIDRGKFWHACYRIEAALGRIFRETRPYGLFPLDNYFCGRTPPPPQPGAALRAAA